ncbi:MAG: tetratricopeptide repeat protein [candidate division KSB1 bacterium]|nr:tetratricopeptide repeat protein [candidate division KSB1 bacterium]
MKSYIQILGYILPTLLVIQTAFGWAQVNNEIRQIQIQQFDRFWRLSFYLNQSTNYQLEDFSQQNRIAISVPARLAAGVPIPKIGAIDVRVKATAAGSRITIALPQPFKYDHFYFPPNQKIVVDFYPLFEFESASQSYEMAMRSLSQGDTARATRLYKAALLQNPDLKNALLRLGEVYFWRKDTAAARTAFEQLLGRARPDIESRAKAYLDSLRQLQAQSADQRGVAAKQVDELAAADSLTSIAVVDTAGEGDSRKAIKATTTEEKQTLAKPNPIIVARRKISRPFYVQLLEWLQQTPSAIPVLLFGMVALSGIFFLDVGSPSEEGFQP